LGIRGRRKALAKREKSVKGSEEREEKLTDQRESGLRMEAAREGSIKCQ